MHRATWLSMLMLAWLQLTMASHQFDHVADYFSDSCHVCAQLDRVDEGVYDHAAQALVFDISAVSPVVHFRGVTPQALDRQFDARAPPRL
ncbi:MAG: hypothetical protein P8M18_07015 [Woeseiaceae bacterium]|nr:hypothetical protein [Woeseiaceae bacterium]